MGVGIGSLAVFIIICSIWGLPQIVCNNINNKLYLYTDDANHVITDNSIGKVGTSTSNNLGIFNK